ncbi:MAG: hypothetical protein M0P61_03555 [Ignavibacteriaceae bacterium]|nr:hypothetical protein [Ignavibacteriaceae bacterium]
MKKIMLAFCISLLTLTSVAQDEKHEVNSEVKELTAFHTVIYKLWHTAWPQKDVGMLQSLLPEIEKGTQNIVAANLPGILREKKDRWDNGIAELIKCVDDYKTASVKNDSLGLLQSAEKLHSQYEKLVRIIRPVIKEVDQFHQELYLVYHYYMPANNYEKILNSAKVLETKVDELKKARLPGKLSSKKSDFDRAALELEASVKKLNEAVTQKNESKIIKEAVVLVHTKYQELEKIFD